ncbi:MAG: hypothetical protein HOH19_15195 [Kordiimonadaceae bacterium]|jgi:hypothetical protein|nr:hypothetical protein [Kordiimonadaceae bacterium]MBT6033916.1 hypothetical protein [Kordiimonadaceae bacterium]
MRIYFILLIILSLASCSSATNEQLQGHADDLNSHQRFGVCYGYGCKHYQKTGLSDAEWNAVRALFSPAPSSAVEERKIIAKAIALIEQYIGPKTGTDQDKARAIVINLSTDHQMDCIDEAFNSTSYLYLMFQDGLIKYHVQGVHLRRNFNELSYPHSTATIHVKGTSKIVGSEGHFVVDSWFHKNGALAEIIPASLWMGPWYPKDKKERYNFSAS